MSLMTWAMLVGLGLSGVIWIYLLAFRGQFWRCDQRLDPLGVSTGSELERWPSICAIVPARNEASMLPQSLPGLLNQEYPGDFRVLLVDDQSTDDTATLARQLSQASQSNVELQILTTAPLPTGWSGKLWAVHQGIQSVLQPTLQTPTNPLPDYFLLTDADIFHDPHNVQQLSLKAERDQLDLVSLMVLLRCQSFWEKLLIPAFIFFFQKLYPFPWVNQPRHPMGAAAGGCILVRREALMAVGGIEVIRKALIDDCALGAAIKNNSDQRRGVWLGLTTTTVSLRPYPSLKSIWDMVARTAFTQLRYSFVLLGGSLIGMLLVYGMPLIGLVWGTAVGFTGGVLLAMVIWALMAIAYWPTVRLYGLAPLWTLSLPIVGLLYGLMTLDSALRHVQGKGGAWKGRVYATESVK